MLPDSEISQIPFLLVTQSSSKISNLYLKAWLLCLHCSYKSSSRNALINHVLRQHDGNKITQPVNIDEVVKNSVLFKDASPDVKFTKTILTIAEYDQLLPSDKDSKRRLEMQDILGVFQCETCSKEFSRLRYLRRHAKTHENAEAVPQFECSECQSAFKTNDLLRNHKKIVHATDKVYRCSQCDFQSERTFEIHVHRQIHSGNSVVCEVCGKAYGDKSTLNKHMRVHDQSRPITCKWTGCTWRFNSEGAMKAHLLSHNKQASSKFVCKLCGFKFRRKQHLQRHETKIHGIAPPKPRPYRNQVMSLTHHTETEDLIEIPSHQLEINEACMFNDEPNFITPETQEGGSIIYETADFTNANFVCVELGQETAFEQEIQ